MRQIVDLNTEGSHRSELVEFPIAKRRVAYAADTMLGVLPGWRDVPNRTAIVRTDTGQCLAIMSDRYTLVEHKDLLRVIDQGLTKLGIGDSPRGLFVSGGGRSMRALYKFPELERTVAGERHCPMVRVSNTYDGTGKVAFSIGAFTFVCTNLSIGGPGAFAAGFVSLHTGTIDVEEIGSRVEDYLSRFPQIVALFERWAETAFASVGLTTTEKLETMKGLEDALPKYLWKPLEYRLQRSPNVYQAYAATTDILTHQTRSAQVAFRLLDRTNAIFQESYALAA